MTLKVDFHVHTDKSVDGTASLAQVLTAAEKAGLDAVAISDHNACSRPEDKGQSAVLVIPACEVSTTGGHMLGLFLNSDLGLISGKLPTPQEAAQMIHASGGVAVMAHPYDKKGKKTIENLENIVDGIETVNPRVLLGNKQGNDEAHAFARKHGLLCTGGSDSHLKCELGSAFTLVQCEGRELLDIKAALLKGDTKPILVRPATNIRKAVSQLHMRLRSKSLRQIAVGVAYFMRAIWRDLLKK